MLPLHARSSYQSTTGAEGSEGAWVAKNSTAVVTSSLRLQLCSTRWAFAISPEPFLHSKARSQEAAVPLEQQVELPSKGRDPQQHFISILCWRWWWWGWCWWQLRGSTRPLGQGGPVVKLLRLILILGVLFFCCLPCSLPLPLHRGGDGAHFPRAACHRAGCDGGVGGAVPVPAVGVGAAATPSTTASRWLLLAPAPERRKDNFPLLRVFRSMETCGKASRVFK